MSWDTGDLIVLLVTLAVIGVSFAIGWNLADYYFAWLSHG